MSVHEEAIKQLKVIEGRQRAQTEQREAVARAATSLQLLTTTKVDVNKHTVLNSIIDDLNTEIGRASCRERV